MQSANILLSLGGDSGNQVPKYNVTAAEIAVLQAIHGEGSVSEILPLSAKDAGEDTAKRTNRVELARLRAIYGNAKDGEGNLVVDVLFPGAAARVFDSLDELELDESLFAAKERVSADSAATLSDDVEDGSLDDLKVGELRDLAEQSKVDLGGVTKKADIIAKMEAAGVKAPSSEPSKQDAGAGDIDEDEVEDLPDGDNGVLG